MGDGFAGPSLLDAVRNAPPKPKKRRGKKTGHVPTEKHREAVKVLRGIGANVETIARLLRLDDRTVRKYYAKELAEGADELILALGAVVVNAGLNGDWRAGLAFLGRFGGPAWRRTERREVCGVDGAPPIQIEPRARVIIVPSEPADAEDATPDPQTQIPGPAFPVPG